jgi:hypothetical protein
MNYIKPEDERLNQFIKEIPEILKKEEKFIDLLSINEIGDLKFRYMEKVQDLFDDAIRRHVIIFLRKFFKIFFIGKYYTTNYAFMGLGNYFICRL